MLLNRGLEVSGLDFEDAETGKAARDLHSHCGRPRRSWTSFFANLLGALE